MSNVSVISWQEQMSNVSAISWQEQMSNVSAISWQEQMTLDEMIMMMSTRQSSLIGCL
jgi:hypothetical protein